MILETMSLEEIANIVSSDYENELYNGYVSCFGMRQRYGKFVEKHIKRGEYHYFGSHEKITRNQNKYIFHFYTHGKDDYKRNGIIRNFWMEYLLKDGIHAVRVSPYDTKQITFYSPHFFDRYRERYLEKEYEGEWTKREAIEHYMLNNELSVGKSQNNPKYPDGLFASTEEGISLGRVVKGEIWEYKTFISFDLLKGGQVSQSIDQKEFAEQLRYLLEKHKLSIEDCEYLKPYILDTVKSGG